MAAGCSGVDGKQLGIAFACVIGAGVASVLGGIFIVLVPVKSHFFLAASLAFAAGVMLYISLVDIYAGKAVAHFVEAGYTDADAFTYSTICFFSGFPISWVLDKIADRLARGGPEHHASAPVPPIDAKGQPVRNTSTVAIGITPAASSADVESGSDSGVHQPEKRRSEEEERSSEQEEMKAVRSRKLVHLGILAALAMALHNMPEGLVTFVGYMDSVGSGITTTVAIAIHNIPEGMVIASAVYFGTGMRWRALGWASLAALTEPLGALIGLAVVCGGSLTPTVFGILFGLVGGIMTYISVKELLPSARSFDPDDRVTTGFLTLGMIIMACSLVAIVYSAPSSPDSSLPLEALPPSAPSVPPSPWP